VLKFHQDNLRFWLNRGVDGIRFDAVAHLIENGESATYDQDDNLALVRALRETISAYDNRFMVVESTARGEVYGAANVGGSAFAFGLNGEIIKAARGDALALAKIARHPMLQPQMATFLGNHDEFAGRRLWNQFDGNLAHYKLAAATLLTLPGAPFIYYGEEIGMSGVRGLLGDPSLRAPMSWDSNAQTAGFTVGKPFRALADNASTQNARSQLGVGDSLHSFYSALLALRNDRRSLHSGRFENPQVEGQVLSFQRLLGDERTLVVINFSATAAAIPRNGAPERAGLRQIFPRGSAVSPLIPAQSMRVFAID
jgi:alpha-amylase